MEKDVGEESGWSRERRERKAAKWRENMQSPPRDHSPSTGVETGSERGSNSPKVS